MKPRKQNSRYDCDNKLRIYSKAPLTKSQYYRRLDKIRPRYLDEYYNTPKLNGRKEEKTFTNIIINYLNDYNKLKNKYNFIDDKSKENIDKYKNLDLNQYELKKRNLNLLFFSYEEQDLEGINFDLTDNLIDGMYNGKNDTLLKTTQTKYDYNVRMNINRNEEDDKIIEDEDNKIYDYEINQKINKKKDNKNKKDDNNNDNNENNKDKINNDNIDVNINEHNKDISEENTKEVTNLNENDLLGDDNFLILKYNDDKIQLLDDIINGKYQEEYQPPLYEVPTKAKKEEENILKEKEDENKLLEEQKNITINKYENGELKRFKDMIVDNKYPLFEQMTDPYFQTNYKPPPTFPRLPEESDDENEKNYYEKNHNSTNKTGTGDIKMLNDIINEENKYPELNEIIDSNKKKKYISNPKNGPDTEENKENNKNSDYSEGEFIENNNQISPLNDEDLKNNMVENIINSNGNNRYDLNYYNKPKKEENTEQLNKDQKNKMNGNYINYENYKENEYPTVDKMIQKDFKESNNSNSNKKQVGNGIKKSVRYNEDIIDKVSVDDLNADDDDDYGGFE